MFTLNFIQFNFVYSTQHQHNYFLSPFYVNFSFFLFALGTLAPLTLYLSCTSCWEYHLSSAHGLADSSHLSIFFHGPPSGLHDFRRTFLLMFVQNVTFVVFTMYRTSRLRRFKYFIQFAHHLLKHFWPTYFEFLSP